MYEFIEQTVENYQVIRLYNPEDGTYIDVVPDLGGTVAAINIKSPKGTVKNVLYGDTTKAINTEIGGYAGRILFPYNDRIPDGKYIYQGKEYQLPCNSRRGDGSIHGLIYNRKIVELSRKADDNGAELVLKAELSESEFPDGYPFKISLVLTYILNELGLLIKFKIINNGDKTAPLAMGWHPYFSLNGTADTWSFYHKGKSYVEVADNLIPTGKSPSVKGTIFDFSDSKSFGADEYDIAISTSEDGFMRLSDGKMHIDMTFDPAFFKYTQIYIPPSRKGVAVEPVSAATNAFNDASLGLIEILPNEEINSYMKIQLNED
jgi:aldose 1-epimerase